MSLKLKSLTTPLRHPDTWLMQPPPLPPTPLNLVTFPNPKLSVRRASIEAPITTSVILPLKVLALLDVEQAWTSVFYLKSFDMDSVQVGKAVFVKEIHTTLGIEPRTNSNTGRYGNPYSVCWFKKIKYIYTSIREDVK